MSKLAIMQKKIFGYCRQVLADKNTRNLSFFLVLNLMFAFVELFYGLVTNSLSLISDSFHMFFDCTALLLGLAASLIAKKRPDESFTYGYGRAEVLTGFANGLFLLFIALFIMKEAIERALEPPEVHHDRLFVISVLGFIVNLVGIFVFQHGGQCSHHDHGHSNCGSHSHSQPHSQSKSDLSNGKHDDSHSHFDQGFQHFSPSQINHGHQAEMVALDMNGYNQNQYHSAHQNESRVVDQQDKQAMQNYDPKNDHLGDIHDHGSHHEHHHHSHHEHNSDQDPFIEPAKRDRGQIMESVFLHILADTLGSVGVMISAVLMNLFGWLIADAICSLFIAILISISVFPLLRKSIYILMQRVPPDLDDKLPSCLQRIQKLPGVLGIHDAHFWTLHGNISIGCLKLEVAHNASHRNVLDNTKLYLNQIGVDRHHIQIEQI